jgi:hypothetical protein
MYNDDSDNDNRHYNDDAVEIKNTIADSSRRLMDRQGVGSSHWGRTAFNIGRGEKISGAVIAGSVVERKASRHC